MGEMLKSPCRSLGGFRAGENTTHITSVVFLDLNYVLVWCCEEWPVIESDLQYLQRWSRYQRQGSPVQ